MASAGPSMYDYTEGASALDITTALSNSRRSRRDSLYSQTDGDAGGSMFDGPGSVAIPSSVSRMSLYDGGLGGRGSSEWERRRRTSQDSSRPRPGRRTSVDTVASEAGNEFLSGDEGEEAEGDDVPIGTRGRRKQRAPSPHPRTSVFENLANLFGRTDEPSRSDRRTSLSHRSSASSSRRHSFRWGRQSDAGSEHALDTDDEREERWGYSSGEENDSVGSSEPPNANDDVLSQNSADYNSYTNSPSPNHTSLPLLSDDPIFGDEVRIDIDLSLDDLDPPPPGPPSRQVIYIPDEDSTFRFVGYEIILWRQYLWRLCCVLTFGILALLGHWFPRLWLKWVTEEKAFVNARRGFVVVEVGYSSTQPRRAS